jgi:segregation and condensation protein A
MLEVKTEKFEGPLDLLLNLIEKEKLDITQISLAKITDSYLKEISEMERSGEEMAEFLVIAAKLLYIKSRELLPGVATEDEEQEIIDLEER